MWGGRFSSKPADIMQAINAPNGSGLNSYGSSVLTRMVPYAATARAIGTAMDPNERTVDSGKGVDWQTTVSQRVQQGVGLRSGLPVAQDVLGRPKENPQQGLRSVMPALRDAKSDPAVRAFREAGVDIGEPPDAITIDGIQLALTPAEQRAWQRERGAILERYAPRLTERAWWGRPEARTAAMQDLLRQANEAANGRVQQQIGGDALRRRLRETAQQKRAS